MIWGLRRIVDGGSALGNPTRYRGPGICISSLILLTAFSKFSAHPKRKCKGTLRNRVLKKKLGFDIHVKSARYYTLVKHIGSSFSVC